MRWAQPNARELGQIGEGLAAACLRRSGWRVIGRRVRTPWAEIDLVFTRAHELVCCEVKTARGRPGQGAGPARRFKWRSLQRQQRAARWLAARRRVRLQPRVELVELWIDDRGRVRWRHHNDPAVLFSISNRFSALVFNRRPRHVD